MTLVQEAKGWLGQQLNGVAFNIDIVGWCSLHCGSCAVGSIGGKRGGKYMSLDLWNRILDKAQSECKVRKIQMYAYSDACLHPDCDKFVAEATKRGIPTLLSTMLQGTRCDFEKVIEARPAEFRISFPGFNKMEYYQAGAKVERFKEKFAEVVNLPRHKETVWSLVFHLYNDNSDEIPMVREMAEKYNLKLVILPAIFMPCEKVVEKNYSEKDKEIISHLLETPEESIARMDKTDYCMMWKQVSMNAEGDVFLCQIVFEQRFKLMNFLDHPLSEIQKTIRNHYFCGKCFKAGGNTYQECFADIHLSKDPVGEANKKRHKTWAHEPQLA